jgi:phospholipase C
MNRRQFLGGGLAGASMLMGALDAGTTGRAGAAQRAARAVLRQPGSLPFPKLAPGTDTMSEIEHFVVVMMENHSFDNVLGLIGRGDGFTLGPGGRPTAKNPDGHGNFVHAFHMPTDCQTDGVGNDWKADLHAKPAFLKPPRLPAPPDAALKSGCLTSGAGTIPPPSAVTTA